MQTVNRFLVILFLTAVPGMGRAAEVPSATAGDGAVSAREAARPDSGRVTTSGADAARAAAAEGDSARAATTDADSARAPQANPVPDVPEKYTITRSAVAGDSGRVVGRLPEAPDSASAARGAPARPWQRRPRYIMLRSVAVPGWGQWANGRHVKALVVAAGEGYLLWRAVDYGRQEQAKAREAWAASDPAARAELTGRHSVLASHRRDFTWWSVFAGLLSMGDAYVDAQLGKFDAEFKPQDAASAGDAPGWRASVTLRW